jgi:hypothetical protein
MSSALDEEEDSHPGAGRFYVYPGSHRIDMVKNGGDFDIASNHARCKALVLDVLRRYNLECRAPALTQWGKPPALPGDSQGFDLCCGREK